MARRKKREIDFKKLVVSLIIGLVAVAFVGSFAFRYISRGGRPENIAVINGEPISMSGDSLFANLYRQYFEEERQKNEEITEEKNLELLRRALDTVIQRTLILQYAKKEGITVTRETALESIIRKGYYASPDKRFDEERYNRTPESDKQRILQAEMEQLIIRLFFEEHFANPKVSDEEVRSFYRFIDFGKKIEYVLLRYDDIPDEELRAFYDENPKLFEQAHVAHLLIKEDEEKAKQLLEEVRGNPEEFEEIVKRESEDTSGEKGGDLGWFYRKGMVAEFSEAAFALEKGEMSDIVETQFGYHIIKAIDSVKREPFESVQFKVKQEYLNSNRDEREKEVALKSKDILQKVAADPSKFGEIVREYRLYPARTDYITLDAPYILNEERNLPLYELMGSEDLVELVFATDLGQVGGPVKISSGEIIYKVEDEKQFDEQRFEISQDYFTRLYENLKQEKVFNDWYTNALEDSRIVDNFNKLYRKDEQEG